MRKSSVSLHIVNKLVDVTVLRFHFPSLYDSYLLLSVLVYKPSILLLPLRLGTLG